MQIDKTAVSTKKPAEIIITVTRFRDVLTSQASRTGRDSDYEMKMRRPHPGVYIKDDVVYVRPPGAIIRFTITSAAGDIEKYYPAGITFVREGKHRISHEHRLGRNNFLQRKIFMDGRSLTLTGSYKHGEQGVRFKFSVIIQRGSDGAIGIIDPGIESDNSDPH